MRVRFVANVNISDQINVFRGGIFEAEEYDSKTIAIFMKNGSVVMAPKDEMDGICEIIGDN